MALETRFRQSYRERDTAVGVLEGTFGVIAERHGPDARSADADIVVREPMDSPSMLDLQPSSHGGDILSLVGCGTFRPAPVGILNTPPLLAFVLRLFPDVSKRTAFSLGKLKITHVGNVCAPQVSALQVCAIK